VSASAGAQDFDGPIPSESDLMVVVDWTSIAEEVGDSMSDVTAIMNSALRAADEYFQVISEGSERVKEARKPWMDEGTREAEIRLWHEIQKAIFDSASAAGKLADLEQNILDRADLGKERAQEHAQDMRRDAETAWAEVNGYKEKQALLSQSIIEADLLLDEHDSLSSEARQDLSRLVRNIELYDSLVQISAREASRLEEFAAPLDDAQAAFDRLKIHVSELCGRARDTRSRMTRLANSGARIMGASEISRAYEKIRVLTTQLNESLHAFKESERHAASIIQSGIDFPRGPRAIGGDSAQSPSDQDIVKKVRELAKRARDSDKMAGTKTADNQEGVTK